MAKKLLLVDGNSLLFRAYHALPALSSSTGQPTGALLGFTEMLLNLLEAEQPDAAALVFDAPGPTFRHEQYEEYKATRPPTPEDLKQQVDLAHEVAEALGLKVLEVPGVEADDVLATLARLGREEGYEVLIVSGDRDLVQVVRPGVIVLATVRGFSDVRRYDAALVKQEFGVEPEQIAELKGLAGDSSDNLPGAPGVGPKTAQKLLDKFGSIGALYEHLDEVEPARIGQSLRDHRDLVELSARMARVRDDVDLPADPEDCQWKGFDVERLRRLMVELEFNKLLPRLPDNAPQPEAATAEIARSPGQVKAIVEEADDSLVVLVAEEKGQATGVALATAARALYVPLQREGQADLFGEAGGGELQAIVAEVLAAPKIKKTGADLKAAMAALESQGISLAGLDFDVELAAYLTAPQRGHQPLEALVARYLGAQAPQVEPADPEAAAAALGRLAHYVRRLRQPLEEQLEELGAAWLFREVEMPLVEILRAMERTGIKVDVGQLQELGEELAQLIAGLQERIFGLVGHEFNLGSPKQLGVVLFEELKLPGGRRTKTGYSTSADVLEKLAVEHEVPRLILEYREYAKLRSTYVEGLLKLADEHGRVHTTFEQMVTATGRLSSRNPNLQNIPIRTEWGRRIRACFVPAEGWVLLSADYSQIELRLLAHLSGDPELVEAFRRGEDIHRRTAALIFGVPPELVDSTMRRVAKTVNFALLYGQGPVALAQQIGVSRAEAERFIASYFQRLPRVKQYLEATIAQARQRLFVETIFGRRRPLPEIRSGNGRIRSYAERAATNAPIQGSAADLIKIAMVRLARELEGRGLQARLLLQVHDELVLEVPPEERDTVESLVKEVMESAAELTVPLTVDVKVGPNWRDLEKLDSGHRVAEDN